MQLSGVSERSKKWEETGQKVRGKEKRQNDGRTFLVSGCGENEQGKRKKGIGEETPLAFPTDPSPLEGSLGSLDLYKNRDRRKENPVNHQKVPHSELLFRSPKVCQKFLFRKFIKSLGL